MTASLTRTLSIPLAAVIALAAAAPAGQPAVLLAIPAATDNDFRLAPARPIEAEPRAARPLLTVEEDGAGWRTRLVTTNVDARQSGAPVSERRIAAGLSFRMVNDGGTLASNLGMAGAVGRALDRLASEAIMAVAGDD